MYLFFFFFNDTATTEIYTLSLHDALPIWAWRLGRALMGAILQPAALARHRATAAQPNRTGTAGAALARSAAQGPLPDRKSTRLNSSHGYISYAVFCLKKKKKQHVHPSCTI